MRSAKMGGGFSEILNSAEIRKIHDTSMRILSEIGVKINHDEILDLLSDAGALINKETKVARVPRAPGDGKHQKKREEARALRSRSLEEC